MLDPGCPLFKWVFYDAASVLKLDGPKSITDLLMMKEVIKDFDELLRVV